MRGFLAGRMYQLVRIDVPCGTFRMQRRRSATKKRGKQATLAQPELTARALAAFVAAGTIEISLDKLATSVGISKRMLIHYSGDRETLEERAMALLEER